MSVPFRIKVLIWMCFGCLWEPSISDKPPQCPSDAKKYENSCLYAIEGHDGWERSREKCQDEKADMVTIPDKIKSDFVLKYFVTENVKAWAGAKREYKDQDLTWVDGTWLMYTGWYNSDTKNSCLQLNSKGWITSDCLDNVTKAICEINGVTTCNWDNGGCEHICIPNPMSTDQRTCSCHEDYVLDGNTKCKKTTRVAKNAEYDNYYCEEQAADSGEENGGSTLNFMMLAAALIGLLILIIAIIVVWKRNSSDQTNPELPAAADRPARGATEQAYEEERAEEGE